MTKSKEEYTREFINKVNKLGYGIVSASNTENRYSQIITYSFAGFPGFTVFLRNGWAVIEPDIKAEFGVQECKQIIQGLQEALLVAEYPETVDVEQLLDFGRAEL